LANQAQLDPSRVLEFQGRSVVGLLIAILFVLISASVEPSQVRQLLPAGRALVAVMVLVLRPLTVALCTWRSTLRGAERAFMAWLAPGDRRRCDDGLRVRAALTQAGIPGAEDSLPVAFVAIVGTWF
jgi:hypothetical protein